MAFPFQKGSLAFPREVTDADLIKQSLIQIVMTPKKSRVMRPNFGTNVLSYIFESNNAILSTLIRREVINAILTYEPRVRLNAVGVHREDASVVITLVYTLRATAARESISIDIS